MTPHDETGATRDPHLLAALRHAPDRDAAPPPQVTARILAAARSAVQPAPPPSWPQRFVLWWRRPQVGAAFGTMLAAVLVGMLWSTREPPPGPGAAAPVPFEAAPPQAAAPAPSAEGELAAASSDRQAEHRALREAAPASVPAAPAKADTPRRPPTPREAEAKARAEPRAAPQRSGAAADSAADAAAALPPAAPAAVAPAPTAAPATAPAATASPQSARQAAPALQPSRPAAAQEQDAASDATAQRRRSAEQLGSSRLELRDGANAAASVPMPSPSDRLARAESAVADPLARLDPWLTASDVASRASWRSAGGTPRATAHGPAQLAWWRGLRAATQGRWQRVEPAVQPPAPWVMLSVDGRSEALWWIVNDELLLADADGRTWRAPITPAQREAWITEVARW